MCVRVSLAERIFSNAPSYLLATPTAAALALNDLATAVREKYRAWLTDPTGCQPVETPRWHRSRDRAQTAVGHCLGEKQRCRLGWAVFG